MTLRIFLYGGLTCLLATGSAWAQSSTTAAGPNVDVEVGYQSLPNRTPARNQSGVALSDSSLLHVGVGAEAGYDSNVFYGASDIRGSGILRVVPYLELTNGPRGGQVSSGGQVGSSVFYDLGAALTYREYLSSDAFIRSQRAFMPSGFGNLEVGRNQALGFGLAEAFTRTEDPPYLTNLGSGPYIRDVNQASAQLRWSPGGGRLTGTLIYQNTLDYFETQNLRVATSMGNLLTLDTAWKWLPKTALTLQVSQGYISYFNTQQGTAVKKPASLPLHALVGLRGLISAKLTVNLAVGYSNGFYDSGRAGPSGVRGSIAGMADLTFRPTLLTTIALGYRHDFQNAILGDFYYVDAVYLNIGQAVAGRVGLGVSARYESRSFRWIPVTGGPAGAFTDRHDNYVQAGANLDYHMRDWTYAGVAYTLMLNDSGYEPANPMDPGRVNYVKHLVFARLGFAY